MKKVSHQKIFPLRLYFVKKKLYTYERIATYTEIYSNVKSDGISEYGFLSNFISSGSLLPNTPTSSHFLLIKEYTLRDTKILARIEL